jgi:hypothetical protein
MASGAVCCVCSVCDYHHIIVQFDLEETLLSTVYTKRWKILSVCVVTLNETVSSRAEIEYLTSIRTRTWYVY